MTYDTVFLFDVDNTLLDNDRVQADLDVHIRVEHGTTARNRYWEIFEALRSELGYADYLGALDRYQREDMHDPRILRFKLRILDSMKKIWADRLTAIFAQQGHYATDPQILAQYAHGDLQLASIGDLVRYKFADLVRQ